MSDKELENYFAESYWIVWRRTETFAEHFIERNHYPESVEQTVLQLNKEPTKKIHNRFIKHFTDDDSTEANLCHC